MRRVLAELIAASVLFAAWTWCLAGALGHLHA